MKVGSIRTDMVECSLAHIATVSHGAQEGKAAKSTWGVGN